ncbi:1-acyl-sn-glycerol-3-phosphate acyltransferase [Bacteroidales bacterium OttesenSCG-928-M11]|nr:1-acyl-sn-glycerol-3-phosphate acyltransferase [Bacteroidales bacterium OttesenSCG-928-M11]
MRRIFILLYQIFIWAPILLVVTLLTALVTIIGCSLGGERWFSYYPGMIWSRIVCIVSLCPIRVYGRGALDKNQSYVFVANHQGAFDIFLVYGYLKQPIKWVMKKELAKIPFVGYACRKAGFIFVDNSTPKAVAKTIQDAEARLKKGASIVIFPEGSRTKDGKLGTFKKGGYQMALDLKLPIVPITINGPFDVMPINSYLLTPHKMEMIIHEPIPTEHLKANDLREAATNIRDLLNKSQKEIESSLWYEYK